MIRKVTALLMFAVAMVNALSLGVGEQAFACETSSTITNSFNLDSQSADTIATEHHRDADSDCHHQENNCHQCHLGHCQYLVASTATSVLKPNGLLRREFADFSWLSIHLPSPDKPPRA